MSAASQIIFILTKRFCGDDGDGDEDKRFPTTTQVFFSSVSEVWRLRKKTAEQILYKYGFETIFGVFKIQAETPKKYSFLHFLSRLGK